VHFYKTASISKDDDSQLDTMSNVYGLTSPKKTNQSHKSEEVDDLLLHDFLEDENIKEESDPEEEMLEIAKDLDKRAVRLQRALKNFDKGVGRNLDLLRDVIKGKVQVDQASYKATLLADNVMDILEVGQKEEEDHG